MGWETERETGRRSAPSPGPKASGARVVQLGAAKGEQVLKRSPARSVRVVAARGREQVVVKRFDSSRAGPLGRLGALGGGARDRTRATNEYELLRALHESGAPVPRPIELRGPGDRASRPGEVAPREAPPAWEVTMEWFPEAVPLIDLFDGSSPWPVARVRLARSLGRLLAELHARGLDHPDLHAGNVLVKPDGTLVAIDFHKARLVERLEPQALEQHLVQLAAGSREFVPPAFRARFLREWLQALPRRLLGPGRGRGALAAAAGGHVPLARFTEQIESRGRALRRSVVDRRQARWTRAGTAVRAMEDGTGWVRIDADPQRLAGLREGRAERCADLIIERPSSRDLMDIWHVAARLYEHRLPCAAPLALATAPRRWLALELPAGARLATADEVGAARRRLEEQLLDRGLRAPLGDQHVWVDGDGRPLIAALGTLADA